MNLIAFIDIKTIFHYLYIFSQLHNITKLTVIFIMLFYKLTINTKDIAQKFKS